MTIWNWDQYFHLLSTCHQYQTWKLTRNTQRRYLAPMVGCLLHLHWEEESLWLEALAMAWCGLCSHNYANPSTMHPKYNQGKVLARDPSTCLFDGQFQFWIYKHFYKHPSAWRLQILQIFTYFIKIVLRTVKCNKNLYIFSETCVFL